MVPFEFCPVGLEVKLQFIVQLRRYTWVVAEKRVLVSLLLLQDPILEQVCLEMENYVLNLLVKVLCCT